MLPEAWVLHFHTNICQWVVFRIKGLVKENTEEPPSSLNVMHVRWLVFGIIS